MAGVKTLAECEGCGEGFWGIFQTPPCRRDCPYHRQFRIDQCKADEAVRRLGNPPTCSGCGTALKRRAYGQHKDDVVWICIMGGCPLYAEEQVNG